MSIYRSVTASTKRGLLLAALCLLSLITLSQTACTRDEVVAAVSTIAVDLEATLQPWGATTVANVQMAVTQVPAMISTSKATRPEKQPDEQEQGVIRQIGQPIEKPAQIAPTATNTIAATETSLPSPTASSTSTPTPTSTSTETPTPSPTATSTPTATPTPYPMEIDVPGGSMLRIPGGTFYMGATAAGLAKECSAFRDGCQSDWFSASEPIHAVLLRSYYIDAHEVTNAAYVEFLNQNGNDCLEQQCVDLAQSSLEQDGSTFAIDETQSQYPVTGATWYGAQAFCTWRDGRLPTEAEWEKAAAWDDKTTTARQYPWGDVFDGRLVNSCDGSCDEPQANEAFDDGFATLAPVASFPGGRSAFGLYDMAGNIWEWVSDWYDPDYYQVSAEANPAGAKEGKDKVVRGGSWFDTGNFMATTIRFPSPPANADRTIGFRCAADLHN